MKSLTQKEKKFLVRSKADDKKLWLIITALILGGLTFSAQGVLSALTEVKIFDYKTFALMYSLLWVFIVLITILFKFKERKFLTIIKKMKA
jgi:hypothetical protein